MLFSNDNQGASLPAGSPYHGPVLLSILSRLKFPKCRKFVRGGELLFLRCIDFTIVDAKIHCAVFLSHENSWTRE